MEYISVSLLQTDHTLIVDLFVQSEGGTSHPNFPNAAYSSQSLAFPTFLSSFGLHVFVSISPDQWQLFICIIICSGLKRKLTPKFHGSANDNNQCFITYAKKKREVGGRLRRIKFLGEFFTPQKIKDATPLNGWKSLQILCNWILFEKRKVEISK